MKARWPRAVRPWLPWILAVVGLYLFPIIVTDPFLRHLAVLSLLFAVAASNWDLTLGYGGVFNFAHITSFGLAAYTSGVLSVRFGVSPWIGILAGVCVAVLVSAVVSIPAIRLRGIYVALITFAFTQLASALIISQTSLTGGLAGLTGVPSLTLGNISFRDNIVTYLYLSGALLVASTLFLRWLVTSDFGLGLVALRDFEEYAVSRGVPLARQRFLAFLYSAIFTGAAGAIYVHYLLVVSPEVLGFSLNTLFLSMVLIGGAGTTYGAILAGILLTFVSELMAPLGPIRFMLVSVLIILTMRFLPQGIWGLARLRRASSSTPLAGPGLRPEAAAVPSDKGARLA